MHELDQILHLWHKCELTHEAAVLATVVKTSGSSYRLPGARLLLAASGERAGSVSGGCLEHDLLKKAFWFTEAGPVFRRYDTTPEGEIGSGFGLGCNGIIHLLLERLQPGEANVLEVIAGVRAHRRAAAIVHSLSRPGERLIVDARGCIVHNVAKADLAFAMETEARMAIAQNTSSRVVLEGSEAFVEGVSPSVRLLLFGAGDDAVPLTSLAKYLGWNVIVFDGRAHYARREKFPHADEVLVCDAGSTRAAEWTDQWTVAVLMSHSYSQDLANLRELAAQPPRYTGILGPHKRSVQLLEDAGLDAAGFGDALHSPVGLDIGADGPEQVALAIIAEIQAVLNGRGGGQLRDRAGSIHAAEASSASAEAWARSIACA